MFVADEPVNLSEPQWNEIHLVSGALKMFLRELPEPVVPFNFYQSFIDACCKWSKFKLPIYKIDYGQHDSRS